MTESAPPFAADADCRGESCDTADACLIYITAPDNGEAIRLGRGLVENGLVAGVNIIPGALSIYRWQGEIRQREEHLLIAQASSTALESVARHIRMHHSYIVPCLIWVRAGGGAKNFLQWISANSRGNCAG